MRLADRQREFAAALLDAALLPPVDVVGPDGEPAPRRFAIYRNNVVVGLVQALRDAYPVVERIVGTEFFQAMARQHAVAAPPRSPMMFDYGAGFADFIAGFAPAEGLPYLAEVARLERAWTEAFHAAEASPIDAAAFAAIGPERLPGIGLVLHPSVRVVLSRFPVLTIWRMNVDGGVAAPVDLAAGGEDALVVRPQAEVEIRAMPPGCAGFIAALGAGRPVVAAFGEALRAAPRFDLAACLTDLVAIGALVGYRIPPGEALR